MATTDRDALIALQLVSEYFIAGDGMGATLIRTNEGAADLVMPWLAERIAQAKAEAYEHAATIADDAREDGDGDPRQIRNRIRLAARAAVSHPEPTATTKETQA